MSGDDYTKPCKVYEIPPFFDVRVPREVAWVADQGYLITRDRLVVEHDDAGDVVSVGKAGEPGWNTINNTEAHRHSVLLRAAKQKSEDLWAVRTGVVSGVVMLDFDGPEGVATLFKLGLQPTLTTPGGGAHVWVSAPGRRVRSAGYDGAGRFSGMEVKAEGAKATFFGVNPHEDGRTYTFTSWPPKVIDWEELPGDLRGYVETLPEASAGEGEADWGSASEPTEQWIRRKLTTAVEKIKNCEGRNDVGFWFLMRLWNQGLTKEQARPWAEEFQELGDC
jgi:hypothetical protein